ncbi:hypothetical protein BSU04_15440 [Caballeronia sordidicola]|uniref:Uncharacterized protein n=1 Tax=Caballeronia sordidicola TaxID=196367 RepID=A0A226X3Q7_CABSO|nr:hypothetical protein BSU04_15440 [Caballeronia sordidicola]
MRFGHVPSICLDERVGGLDYRQSASIGFDRLQLTSIGFD